MGLIMEKSSITRKTVNNEVIIIKPVKTLDNNNAHEMVDIITGIQEEGYKTIIIDMNELEFLSSAGVGSILGTIENSRETGGDIILCNVPESIYHILKVLDLVDYLTISEDIERARHLAHVEA
jgi:anti-sigma B factor antagonist